MDQFEQFLSQNYWLFILLALWTIPWKGWALWRAAKRSEKLWFCVLLVVNTLGILEIAYIFGFSRQPKTQIPSNPQN